ncbi:nickel/cobalt transporter [Streptomyces fulvorobeus]|uniref:ABC-type nickel/cobalt efflux system permease component RcnA n=1 Tax=Streptomyces fulvorobeus TaxID=284028 RepID=A0A7J0CH27_9ACTN|nr:sulfite exporter TauE/SafE family protein [Streptomyces fulvorobeus]NYE44474.1 ABC-type nickel/cobalt efflux system permease component RcnA [Streptomyces fulvorobeus]GFN01007.1 hypothetical protein Sfulv_58170 [Streptomyces fulvorobeus]
MIRTLLRAVAGPVTAFVLTGAAAPAALAHPLGNFTVNHHTGLTLRPDRVDALVVVDRAEIAAVQEFADIDRDRDGSLAPQESTAYATANCAKLARQVHATAGGSPLRWTPVRSALSHHPGEAGLETSRLECSLTATAGLRSTAAVELRTSYDTRRVGWQEITARGDGVQLTASDVPADSPTDELRRYPEDPLAAPPDRRTATVSTGPGHGSATTSISDSLGGTGPLAGVADRISTSFTSLVGTRELTVPVGLLALALAIVLGASHAVLPGHGKTLMAAYLAGRRGTPRDALTVGATVTVTHTAGVLILGLALPLATHLAGETVLTWLGIASGLLVTSIGLWLLRGSLLDRKTGHHHGHGHHHHHGFAHGRHHPHEHPHTGADASPPVLPGSRHPHHEQEPAAVALLTRQHAAHPHPPEPTPSPARTNRGGLVGMGIAGGLVPSPSALVVLLGAVALGRTVFGVLLVVAYGLGMAGTLTLAGLLLVRLRDRVEAGMRTAAADRWTGVRRLARYGPVATAALVLVVGIGLTTRAALGPW